MSVQPEGLKQGFDPVITITSVLPDQAREIFHGKKNKNRQTYDLPAVDQRVPDFILFNVYI